MDMSLFLLSSRGRIDRAALGEIVKRSNERRRRIFTKVAELGFQLIMFFFGGLEVTVKTAAGTAVDASSDKVSLEDKMNAVLEGLKVTNKGNLFREFMRPLLITAAEILASMMEPDEMMMNIFAGADPLTGSMPAPQYQPPALPGPQVWVQPSAQSAPQPSPGSALAAQYEGQLIKDPADPRVFHIYGGRRHWVTTMESFNRRGYNGNSINRNVPLSVIMQIPPGTDEG